MQVKLSLPSCSLLLLLYIEQQKLSVTYGKRENNRKALQLYSNLIAQLTIYDRLEIKDVAISPLEAIWCSQ